VRIFRSDDGAEIREDDLRALAEFARGGPRTCEANSIRVLAALAPKTCGAMLASVTLMHIAKGHDEYVPLDLPCVLPPGHHPFDRYSTHPYCTVKGCNKLADDPIHSPGHQTAPECWRES
jgi:hypothetical protein